VIVKPDLFIPFGCVVGLGKFIIGYHFFLEYLSGLVF
jgi:hypothetical protein